MAHRGRLLVGAIVDHRTETLEIVIEFRDKGRAPAISEEMPALDAKRAFGELASALEESGPEGDRWIRVGETVVVRAREVHNVALREPPYSGFA
jgi:hypothetical protein